MPASTRSFSRTLLRLSSILTIVSVSFLRLSSFTCAIFAKTHQEWCFGFRPWLLLRLCGKIFLVSKRNPCSHANYLMHQINLVFRFRIWFWQLLSIRLINDGAHSIGQIYKHNLDLQLGAKYCHAIRNNQPNVGKQLLMIFEIHINNNILQIQQNVESNMEKLITKRCIMMV